MKKLILAFALLISLSACKNFEINYNVGFEDILAVAREGKKPLCVVLLDHGQYVSGDYVWILNEDYGDLRRRAVFDVVDIDASANEWFVKWLCPLSVPLTCVFSQDGELVDLIQGMGGESFLYISESLGSMAATECEWPNRFNLDKSVAIPVLRDIMEYKSLVNGGIFPADGIERSIKSLCYPYNVWLKLAGQLMTGDTLRAAKTTQELLELETPYYLKTYRDEFILANRVLDPDFELENSPNIRVVPKSVQLGDCAADRAAPFDIDVYNDGNRPLTISAIATSCSCVRRLGGEEPVSVPSGDSVRLSFVLSPAGEGEANHEVLLISNGLNNPFLNISVTANFRSEP